MIRRLLRLDPPPGYVVRYDPRFGWEALRVEHVENDDRMAQIVSCREVRWSAVGACWDDVPA